MTENEFTQAYLALKNGDKYEYCWITGDYTDQFCEECPHAYECSGYTGDTYED